MGLNCCKICNVMIVTYEGCRPHVCLPYWFVMIEESHGDETLKVYSRTAEDAAIEVIERDPDSWEFIFNRAIRVKVRDGDRWREFDISAEMVAQFSASEKTNE